MNSFLRPIKRRYNDKKCIFIYLALVLFYYLTMILRAKHESHTCLDEYIPTSVVIYSLLFPIVYFTVHLMMLLLVSHGTVLLFLNILPFLNMMYLFRLGIVPFMSYIFAMIAVFVTLYFVLNTSDRLFVGLLTRIGVKMIGAFYLPIIIVLVLCYVQLIVFFAVENYFILSDKSSVLRKLFPILAVAILLIKLVVYHDIIGIFMSSLLYCHIVYHNISFCGKIVISVKNMFYCFGSLLLSEFPRVFLKLMNIPSDLDRPDFVYVQGIPGYSFIIHNRCRYDWFVIYLAISGKSYALTCAQLKTVITPNEKTFLRIDKTSTQLFVLNMTSYFCAYVSFYHIMFDANVLTKAGLTGKYRCFPLIFIIGCSVLYSAFYRYLARVVFFLYTIYRGDFMYEYPWYHEMITEEIPDGYAVQQRR